MPLRCVEWAGLAAGCAGGLAVLGGALHLHTRAQLRDLRAHLDARHAALVQILRRDSVEGIGRMAEELRSGYSHLADTQHALERLAVAVADRNGVTASEPCE
jgi:hypothetical protein